ncbi:PAS domain S-box-containing protein [Microvirga flocculans]|uniref:Blue-light-activated histidine kinase n=1 Tax=Microvirga flocculans TaxID=217168 RepID=A0A7W6IH15_9HYPH|nr:PAS domain S-box protein [Microvirga flocculans]MBB4040694.1 PAS domain S-box-containing protein [Microvirga flocculans]
MSPTQSWAYGLNEIRFQAGAEGFSREALSELLENVPLAIAVTLGPQQRFVFANRLFRSAMSATEENLIGRTVQEVMGKSYTPDIGVLRQKVFETGEPQGLEGYPIVLTSGTTTYWDVKLLPVRDGDDRISGILTLAANVTERVKARSEAEIKAREVALHNERLALAVEATEMGLWEWNAQTGETFWSDRQKDIFGLSKGEPATYEFWHSAIHPEDRERVVSSVEALSDPRSGGQLHIEHRIVRPDGELRWILSHGRMLYEIVNGELKPARLLGTIIDATERRRNEEIRQLLVQELNHRVKNLFAMTSGMIALTARMAETPKQMAEALRGRIEALARAHELIRPAITGTEPTDGETSVEEIAQAILAPHINRDAPSSMTLEGPAVRIGPKAATILTLVLHELATNASKYGALSAPEGRLNIAWRQGATLTLLWREENGPILQGPPATEGFGSKLARRSVTDQLGGAIAYEWEPEGLKVRIEVPLSHLND